MKITQRVEKRTDQVNNVRMLAVTRTTSNLGPLFKIAPLPQWNMSLVLLIFSNASE